MECDGVSGSMVGKQTCKMVVFPKLLHMSDELLLTLAALVTSLANNRTHSCGMVKPYFKFLGVALTTD